MRSTIKFPYATLTDAVQIAEVVHNDYGGECSDAQLAASLGSTTSSSTFRTKLAAAKTFGVIRRHRGRSLLTDLGGRVVDPSKAARAKVDAFLNVPLYTAVHDRYEGSLLPAGHGLDTAIIDLGVTPKSATRARQVLLRSAESAGFFDKGKTRLVKPAFPNTVSAYTPEENSAVTDAGEKTTIADSLKLPDSGPGRHTRLDPLLRDLWTNLSAKLPSPSSDFPADQRDRWLEMWRLAFDVVYGPDDAPLDGKLESPGAGITE